MPGFELWGDEERKEVNDVLFINTSLGNKLAHILITCLLFSQFQFQNIQMYMHALNTYFQCIFP